MSSNKSEQNCIQPQNAKLNDTPQQISEESIDPFHAQEIKRDLPMKSPAQENKNLEEDNQEEEGSDKLQFQRQITLMERQIVVRLGSFKIKEQWYYYAQTSCGCCTEKNRFRQVSVYVMNNVWFDRFLTFCIVANSIMLTTKEYESNYDVSYLSERNSVLELCDVVFTVIFLIECIIKIIAMGFILEKRSYLRETWNWIDFIITIISVVSLTPFANQETLKVFRTARVLRPLRSINALETMRDLIQTIGMSLPKLLNVGIALIFVMTMFSIFGVNFFVGQQYNFCRMTKTLIDDGISPPIWPINPDASFLCQSDEMCSGWPNNLGEGVVAKCGNVYTEYGLDPVVVDDTKSLEIIQYDLVNFNNVGQALITVFQVITLEGWSQLMYNYMDAVSSIQASLFFIWLVVVGAFVIINLVLAALMHTFIQVRDEKNQKEAEKKHLQQQKNQTMPSQQLKSSIQENRAVDQVKRDLKLDKSERSNTSEQSQREFIEREDANLDFSSRLSVPDKQVGEMNNPSEQDDQRNIPLTQNINTLFNEEIAVQSDFDQDRLPYLRDQTRERFAGILAHQQLEAEINDINCEDKEMGQINDDSYQSISQTLERGIDQTTYQLGVDRVPSAIDSNILIGESKISQQSKSNHQQSQLENQQAINQDILTLRAILKNEKFENAQQQPMQLNSNSNQNSEQTEEKQSVKQKRCQTFFQELVLGVTFNFTIYCLILLNTVTLALFRYDQSSEQTAVLAILDTFFVWAFTLEMVLKLIGLGFRNYSRDRFNIFDATIVIISLVDFSLFAAGIINDSQDNAIVSALRALRLLRIFKLVRQWKELQKILLTIFKSFNELYNVSFLLLLFMFIQALLGMELFAYSVCFDKDEEIILGYENVQKAFEEGKELVWPRENFNNIFNSIVTIFILIMQDDWNQIMQLYTRAIGIESELNWYLSIFYFLITMIIGNIVFLALFTSLLLKHFDPDDEDSEFKETKEAKQERRQRSMQAKDLSTDKNEFKFKRCCEASEWQKSWKVFCENFVKIFGGDAALERRRQNKEKIDAQKCDSPVSVQKQDCYDDTFVALILAISNHLNNLEPNSESSEAILRENLQRPPNLLHYDYQQMKKFVKRTKQRKAVTKTVLKGRSLYLFRSDNSFRKFCAHLTSHQWFDNIIILLIVISTITLAFEDPLLDPKGETIKSIELLDLVMTCLFTLEALLKIISRGLIMNGKHSYLKSSWNILDFIIVVFALVSQTIDADISFIKVFRVARILRPLRLIQRAQGLKIAIKTLFKAFPDIFRLQVIVCFVTFMISILLTTLFSGKLSRCDLAHTALSPSQSSTYIKTKWDCLNYGGQWLTPKLNFDDTMSGMLTLFIFQSTEGWIGLMWDVVDGVGVDQAPIPGHNVFLVALFMILVVLLCVLFANMFVGIVIDTYNTQKEFCSFNELLEPSQRSWLKLTIMSYKIKPVAQPRSQDVVNLQHICTKVIQNKNFDSFIMLCIILNTAVLALVWFDMPDLMTRINEILNFIFMAIFTFEAVIKIIALRKNYFKDSWNIFDFIIVAMTLLILVLRLAQIEVQFGSSATILRALRIGRILRLLKRLKSLQIIFMTLVDSFESLGSLGVLLIILFFMFAIIGRSVFGFAHIGSKSVELNQHVNFRNFWSSFFVLLRSATGESWHQVMFDLSKTYSADYQCRDDESYDTVMVNNGETFTCGNPIVSYSFFILFHILVSQIFMNLFVAIIIDAFLGQSDQFRLIIQPYSLYEYMEIWSKFDPDATGFIAVRDLESFIMLLAQSKEGSALVIFKEQILENKTIRYRFLSKLNIPTYYQLKKIHFYDTLQQLCDKVNLLNYRKDQVENLRELVDKTMLPRSYLTCDYNVFNQIMGRKSTTIDFDKTIARMGRLNNKIELMTTVQQLAYKLHKSVTIYADTETNIMYTHEQRLEMQVKDLVRISQSQELAESNDVYLYTTKHYFHGRTLYRVYKERKRLGLFKAAARSNSNDQSSSQHQLQDDLQRSDSQGFKNKEKVELENDERNLSAKEAES